MDNFKLLVEASGAPPTKLVALLRRHTGCPIAEIRQALVAGTPVVDTSPQPNQLDDFIHRTTALLDDLEANGVSFQLRVDGVAEELQSVRNGFLQWAEIKAEIQAADDRRFGDEGGS